MVTTVSAQNSNETREGEYGGPQRTGENIPLSPSSINNTSNNNITRGNDYPLDAASYLTAITLITTGVVSLFRGNKYRWLSIFLAAFYATSIGLMLFILKYQNVINPSSSARFVYFIICVGSGSAAGLFFVCMWPTGKIIVGSLGGFSLAMICLLTRNNGLIPNQIFRWVFMGVCTLIMGSLASIQKIYNRVAIFATVATGCYSLILGTDIFARAGILASFKTFWGFIQPENYQYVVDTNVIIILSSIALVGGIFGIGFQFLEFWIKQKREKSAVADDTENISDNQSRMEKNFTQRLKNYFFAIKDF
ncbi:3227_t:CDS:2 [Acaulospora morrowiae]|uniref:3227_t:CDS:1 n=1 Tax=Acaulospora morrowiae TaxID=94023 RepID=A0A9N9DWK7_9GLOM|nr:3227_t:CDS:2 [Acaulospora morrowiae]